MVTYKEKRKVPWPSWPCLLAETDNYLTDYKSSYRQYSSRSRTQIVPLRLAAGTGERRHNPQPPKIQFRSTYQDAYYKPWKSDILPLNSLFLGEESEHKTKVASRQTSTQQSYQQPYLTDRLKGPTTRYGSSHIYTKPAQGTLPTLMRKADMNSRQHTQYTANYSSSSSKFDLPKLDDHTNSLTGLGSSTRKVRFRQINKKGCNSGWAGPC